MHPAFQPRIIRFPSSSMASMDIVDALAVTTSATHVSQRPAAALAEALCCFSRSTSSVVTVNALSLFDLSSTERR